MRRCVPALLSVGLGVLLTGCASSGSFRSTHITEIGLDDADYAVVATNVSGEASAGYLVGVTGSFSGETRTVALARVSGPDFLYAAALSNLWRNFESEHGAVEDRALALTNVRFDADALNPILYTRSAVSVRADVVEFR